MQHIWGQVPLLTNPWIVSCNQMLLKSGFESLCSCMSGCHQLSAVMATPLRGNLQLLAYGGDLAPLPLIHRCLPRRVSNISFETAGLASQRAQRWKPTLAFEHFGCSHSSSAAPALFVWTPWPFEASRPERQAAAQLWVKDWLPRACSSAESGRVRFCLWSAAVWRPAARVYGEIALFLFFFLKTAAFANKYPAGQSHRWFNDTETGAPDRNADEAAGACQSTYWAGPLDGHGCEHLVDSWWEGVAGISAIHTPHGAERDGIPEGCSRGVTVCGVTGGVKHHLVCVWRGRQADGMFCPGSFGKRFWLCVLFPQSAVHRHGAEHAEAGSEGFVQSTTRHHGAVRAQGKGRTCRTAAAAA